MNVAIIHDWLTGMRGGEKVLEVLCGLFPNASLYTLLHIEGTVSKTIENMNIRTSFIQGLPLVKKKYRYYLPLFPAAIEQFDMRGYDLVLSSSHCVAKGVIPSPHTCHISYIHSPMRYIWDMYYEYFGRDRGGVMSKMLIPLFASYLRTWDTASNNRVDYFIANSHHVRRRIRRCYDRDAEVIYPPVDVERFRVSEGQGDYYLIVSSFVPYKKIDLAIGAFNRSGLSLKIIGTGQEEKRLKKMAGSNIEFLGWKSDGELIDYYAACKALIFPGQEDFGIVPLEAMSCGKPVIAYGKGGALETVIPTNQGAGGREQGSEGVSTGVLFYEQTVESLINAVGFFEKNLHLFDKEKTRRHAMQFDRSIFKKRIMDFINKKYEEFGDGRGSREFQK